MWRLCWRCPRVHRLILNIGCGGHPFPAPWINIDRSTGSRGFPCHPDVIADVRDLPFDDGSVDAIYAGHVLEHIEYEDCPAAVREMRRVLRPGGRLAVVGPDMDRAHGEWAEFAPLIWPGLVGEWSSWPGAAHQYIPTAANTLAFLEPVFPNVVEIPIVDLDPFWPAPSRDGWQFAFVA